MGNRKNDEDRRPRPSVYAVTAGALIDFKAAVERREKSKTHFNYALACGLIGVGHIERRISTHDGQELLSTLKETRVALMDTFGEAPAFDMPPIS